MANAQLALVLFIAAGTFFAARQTLALFTGARGLYISATMMVTCLFTLMLVLVITGGAQSTGPLWIYIIPPVIMFFMGVRYGTLLVGGFTIVLALVLFVPMSFISVVDYTEAFKSRLIYSFLTLTFLSAFYEFSRQGAYVKAINLSNELERLALFDTLTGLPNRRATDQALEHHLAQLERNKTPFSIVLADVDRFKSINDNYGHHGGDATLQQISWSFLTGVRKQDTVGRWGGEEFIFVLPMTKEANASILAEKIRQKLAEIPIILDDKTIHITASFGVSEVIHADDLDRALSAADKALYYAKQNGRNQVVCASNLPND